MIVYTCLFGGRDKLQPPRVVDKNTEYFCFTDKKERVCEPWLPLVLERKEDNSWKYDYSKERGAKIWEPLPFARISREPKILAHKWIDTDISVYHDANLIMNVSPFALIDFLNTSPIALFRHPYRHCIYNEIQNCIDWGKDSTARLRDYESKLRREEYRRRPYGSLERLFLEGMGLWSGGVIIRRHEYSAEIFNNMWWEEFIDSKTCRDQIPLAYIIIKFSPQLSIIPGNIFDNILFEYRKHLYSYDQTNFSFRHTS